MKHKFFNKENYSLLIPFAPVIETLEENKDIHFVEIIKAFECKSNKENVFINVYCNNHAHLDIYGETISGEYEGKLIRGVSVKLTHQQVKEIKILLGIR